jgi:LDH2 family malate/lactate/ureidoglycolate dehydrogenase
MVDMSMSMFSYGMLEVNRLAGRSCRLTADSTTKAT